MNTNSFQLKNDVETYPETKTPVPNRNKRFRLAVMTSATLSGLTANRFGSGGLKLGGGVIEETPDFGSSLIEVEEVEAVSEISVDDLITETLLLLDVFVLR